MSQNFFGKLLKRLRMARGLTLREFCLQHGFDPGNYSRLERGLYPAPQKEELLAKYAQALDLQEGSDDWLEFFDTAAATRGQLPKDLLSDNELLDKLPALFRTLRGQAVPAERLDHLIEEVKRG